MKKLTLFRGIAVPSARAAVDMQDLTLHGMDGKRGQSEYSGPIPHNVREQIDELFARPNLRAEDFMKERAKWAIAACGSEIGGEYYAAKHNLYRDDDYPIVVEFQASLERIYVDSRDFLCPVIQGWDLNKYTKRDIVASHLEQLYGPAILRYFEAAAETKDTRRRIAMCNLACFDVDVILAHHKNRRVIGGRYDTRFESAFFVQAPIEASAISQVRTVSNFEEPRPAVTLGDLIRPKPTLDDLEP